MSDAPKQRFQILSPRVRVAIALGIAVFVLIVSFFTPPAYNEAIVYLVLLVFAIRSSPRVVWALAGLFVVFSFAGLLVDVRIIPRLGINPQTIPTPLWFNRLMIALSLFVEAGIIHMLTGARKQAGESRAALQERNSLLQSANAQLRVRDTELDAEQRRLQTVLKTLPFGITVGNADLSQMHTNPAGSKLLGIPQDDATQLSSWPAMWSLHRNGQQVPLNEYPMVLAVQQKKIDPGTEYEIHFNDNRPMMSLLISAAPILDKDGNVSGGVAAFADVTEQRTLRDQLNDRRLEAEAANVRKTRLLTTLSHDMRNPVNAITLLTELIFRDTSSPDTNADLAESVRELRATASSLAHFLSDVLDMGRLDAGLFELHFTDVAMKELLDESCRYFSTEARGKHLQFACNDSGLYLHTDRMKLNRAIANLVGNAVKFTPAGEVRLDSDVLPDGRLRISVQDTGPGIPADQISGIFDEFVQLQNPERNHNKGVGLGLSICRRIVLALGGELEVQSKVGEGSRFTILLPAATVIPRPAVASGPLTAHSS